MGGTGDSEISQHHGSTDYPLHKGDSMEMTSTTNVSPSTKTPEVEVHQVDETSTERKKGPLAKLCPFLEVIRKRLVLVIYAAATGIILLFITITLITARARYGVHGDVGTITKGSCADMEKVNSNLHLVINILSTVVLIASTSFMLVAHSPSRPEIDAAHERHRCLSVGSLGFGNLLNISWKKSAIYLLLMVTSSPYHLLANSAIVTNLAANGYNWAIVSEQFVLDTNHTQRIVSSSEALSEEQEKVFTAYQKAAPTYDKLDNQQCAEAYADVYQSQRRTVLVVVGNTVDRVAGQNVSQIYKFDKSFAGKGANNWICGKVQSDDYQRGVVDTSDKCDIRGSAIAAVLGLNSWTGWKVFNQTVRYCRSEKVDPQCSVQYSPTILGLLILCNALKLAAMIFILYEYSGESNQPLSCPGDAAASFLEREDPTTTGMCLATRKGVKKLWKDRKPKPYKVRVRRRWRGVPRFRWTSFYCSMCGFLFGIFCLMIISITMAKRSSHAFHFFSNFGKVNTDILSIGGGAAKASLLQITGAANVGQFILAVMWILYRDAYTSMAFAQDWSWFEWEARTLMVSRPQGLQRRIWFLGIDWVSGVLLILMQMLMHFLVSQSVFPVRLVAYDESGAEDPANSVSNIGYSPVAIFVSLLVCLVLLFYLLRAGSRPLHSSGPVVATCSAAISAECHPAIRREGMETAYLRWGEVRNYTGLARRHCSLASAVDFNNGQAHAPEGGVLYE